METFVVRVWRQGAVDPGTVRHGPSPGWIRGVVRHVGQGTESTFDGPDELVALLGSAAGSAGEADPASRWIRENGEGGREAG
jgi:hypothetical protein